MMNTPPIKSVFIDMMGNNDPSWTSYMSDVFYALLQDSQYGTTAKRPTKNLRLWMRYGDTTLGYPVYLKSTNPNVWVNSVGTTV